MNEHAISKSFTNLYGIGHAMHACPLWNKK